MAEQHNGNLAQEMWHALVRGDLETALQTMSEDVTWVVPGLIPHLSGVKKGKEQIAAWLMSVAPHLTEFQSEIHGVYCDGSAVIMELTNRAHIAGGRLYENEYCFVLQVHNAKIASVHEYTDTQKVAVAVSAVS
jgi:ketosteroid isomerase-like protein